MPSFEYRVNSEQVRYEKRVYWIERVTPNGRSEELPDSLTTDRRKAERHAKRLNDAPPDAEGVKQP